jgi:hypothetical protein
MSRRMNSVFWHQKFPVQVEQGIYRNVLELLRELDVEHRRKGQKFANSLLFSLFSGNPRLPIQSPPIAIRALKTSPRQSARAYATKC